MSVNIDFSRDSGKRLPVSAQKALCWSNNFRQSQSVLPSRSRSIRPAEVLADGESLVPHGGIALLSELGNRSGLTGGKVETMAECGPS